MRLKKEDYKKAVEVLKRYNYNCINIINIQSDILSISVAPISDMPRVPCGIGNTTLNKVIQLEDNKELQQNIREYKAVVQALQLVDELSKEIFEEEFRKGNRKWQVINKLKISESTYERRKKDIIYATNRELKKLTEN